MVLFLIFMFCLGVISSWVMVVNGVSLCLLSFLR